MRFPQRPGAFLARRFRGPRNRVLRFVVIGAVVVLVAAAGVGPVRSAVNTANAQPLAVEQAANTGLLQRPLGTAFGQQSQAEADLGDGTTLAAWELKDGVKE